MVRFITVTCISSCLYFLLPSLKYLTNALMRKKFYFCLRVWYKDTVHDCVTAEARGGRSHCIILSRQFQWPLTASFEFNVCHSHYPMSSDWWPPIFRVVFLPHLNIFGNSAIHTHSYLWVYQGIISPVKFTMENTQCCSVLLMGIFESFRLP